MFNRKQLLIGLARISAIFGLVCTTATAGISLTFTFNQDKFETIDRGITLQYVGTTFLDNQNLNEVKTLEVKPHLSFTCDTKRLTAMVRFMGSTLSSDVLIESPYPEKMNIAFGPETGFYMEVSIGETEDIHIVYPEEIISTMKNTQKMYKGAEMFQVIATNEDGIKMVANFDVSDIEKVEDKIRDAGCNI